MKKCEKGIPSWPYKRVPTVFSHSTVSPTLDVQLRTSWKETLASYLFSPLLTTLFPALPQTKDLSCPVSICHRHPEAII